MTTTTERLARYETAQEVLGFLMAGYTNLIWNERAKDCPSVEKINAWEAEHAAYFKIESSLRLDDEECIERVLSVYGPKAKAMYAGLPGADLQRSHPPTLAQGA